MFIFINKTEAGNRRLAPNGPALVALTLILLSAPMRAADAKPGASYRGIPWGTPVIEAMRILEAKDQSMSCPPNPGTLDKFDCGGVALIGDVLVQNTFVFENGKLQGVLIRFDSTDYPFLKSVFIEKFGTPNVAEKSIVQNLSGAALNTDALMWVTPEAKVVLIERLVSMTKGLAIFGPAAWFERFTKTGKDQVKKAAGDF